MLNDYNKAMPIYTYKCVNCGHLLEVIQKISDDPLSVCPKCQGQLARQFHPVGIIFKGTGFYTTDYKRQPNGQKKEVPKKETAPKKEAASS